MPQQEAAPLKRGRAQEATEPFPRNDKTTSPYAGLWRPNGNIFYLHSFLFQRANINFGCFTAFCVFQMVVGHYKCKLNSILLTALLTTFVRVHCSVLIRLQNTPMHLAVISYSTITMANPDETNNASFQNFLSSFFIFQ